MTTLIYEQTKTLQVENLTKINKNLKKTAKTYNHEKDFPLIPKDISEKSKALLYTLKTIERYGEKQGLLYFYTIRDFIPQKANIQIISIPDDFFYWLLPLIARDDINILLSYSKNVCVSFQEMGIYASHRISRSLPNFKSDNIIPFVDIQKLADKYYKQASISNKILSVELPNPDFVFINEPKDFEMLKEILTKLAGNTLVWIEDFENTELESYITGNTPYYMAKIKYNIASSPTHKRKISYVLIPKNY